MSRFQQKSQGTQRKRKVWLFKGIYIYIYVNQQQLSLKNRPDVRTTRQRL